MTRGRLDEILARLAGSRSFVTPDRTCLAYTAGGNVPDAARAVGCELRWRGSAVPWWLAPLRLIAAANRTLFELVDSRDLPGFVAASDSCFTVRVYSCPRMLAPAVIAHMRHAGVRASPGDVIVPDPAFFELEINCDGGSHEAWLVFSRCGRDCPEDLVVIARAVDDGGEGDNR